MLSNIWLVGGTTVIPTSVEKAIEGDGYTVKRISGEDRYETAAAIAEAGIKLSGKKPSKVFVASGTSFADALAVSPVAYGKGYPIILTEKDKTSDASKKELGNIGSDTKILVGGTAVVSDAVAKDLTVSQRVAGDDRAVTANLVSDWAKKSEGFNPANAALVGGTNGNGADSLVASALGAKSFTTLHFAGWDATYTYLKDHSSELTGKGFVFGGKAAVSDEAVGKAQSAAQTVKPNTGIAVSSDAKAIQQVSTTDSGKENRGSVTYTFSSDADKVNIALWASTNVVAGADGTVKFKTSVPTTDATVNIESVNGAALKTAATGGTASGVVTAKPVNGKVVFTVDAAVAGQYTPVVWVDKDGGVAQQLGFSASPSSTSPQAPNEVFGVGASTRWIPSDSTGESVAITAADITFVNKAEKYFTTATKTFHYDANDKFLVDADLTPRDLDYFEARLTKGDDITIAANAYAPSGAQSSTFTLLNTTPGPVTVGSTAADTTTSSVTLTLSGVSDDASKVRIFGAKTSAAVAGKDAPLLATVTADADSSTSGYQVKVSGLETGISYDFWATQEVDGEETTRDGVTAVPLSTDSNKLPLASTVALSDNQATGAAGNGTLSTGDKFSITFPSAVSVSDDWSLTIRQGTTNVTVDKSNASAKLLNGGKSLQVTLGDDYLASGQFDITTLIQIVASSGVKNDTGNFAVLPSANVLGTGAQPAKPTGGAIDISDKKLSFTTSAVASGGSAKAYVYDAVTNKLVAKSGTLSAGASGIIAGSNNNLTLESGAELSTSTNLKVVLVTLSSSNEAAVHVVSDAITPVA